MAALTVRLEDETYKWVDKMAKKNRKSKNTYIKEILEMYKENYEDSQIARKRIKQKDAKYLTTEELEAELGHYLIPSK